MRKESARLLIELQKQGFEKPIFGETVLIAQSVIDLAKGAAEGAQGHVGLSGAAPMPLVQEFAKKFQDRYGRATDHNGIKGYIALYILKEITERMGEFNSQRLAQELHCTKITTEQEPGVLIDIVYDDKGNVDRESFLVEVKDNKQVGHAGPAAAWNDLWRRQVRTSNRIDSRSDTVRHVRGIARTSLRPKHLRTGNSCAASSTEPVSAARGVLGAPCRSHRPAASRHTLTAVKPTKSR